MKIGTAEAEKVLDVAIALARRVGARIRKEVESSEVLDVTHKGISDIVTAIDLWSEKEITETVAREFPEHLVIGEETSAALAETRKRSLPELLADNICWVVDPLDGTSNFSNKLPHSAVSLAVVERGVRVLGVVFDPFRDELFHAVKNGGAFLNGRRLSCSKKTELVKSLVAIGFPNDRWIRWSEYQPVLNAIIMSCRNVRACGAAAIEICWVAAGRLEGFFEYNIKAWDVAAGSIIVEEAGGRAASFDNVDGKDFSLFAGSYLLTCEGVHGDLRRVIESRQAKSPI